MKNIISIALALLLLASCKPEIKGELGESFSKIEGIAGNWELNVFSQRDENNPIKEVRDLSEFYVIPGEQPTRISFNSDDFTYAVIPGAGRNYFGTGGTWRFDDNAAPAYIFLEGETDTLQLKLGSMPRTYNQFLKLELPRFCTDASGNRTPTVTYIFTIQRAQ